jgi:NADPH-dependent ferric siderophore reductase
MRARLYFLLTTIVLGACSTAGGPYPSLRPRAAEAIDPRIQPVRPINDRPATPALAARLAALVDEARAGETAFGPAAGEAERLAAAAGPSQSESWIAAQEALSAAIAARNPTALAQADIDALGATALQTQGGIAPNDLKAINNAASEVLEIARGQTDRIAAIQKRLGI